MTTHPASRRWPGESPKFDENGNEVKTITIYKYEIRTEVETINKIFARYGLKIIDNTGTDAEKYPYRLIKMRSKDLVFQADYSTCVNQGFHEIDTMLSLKGFDRADVIAKLEGITDLLKKIERTSDLRKSMKEDIDFYLERLNYLGF